MLIPVTQLNESAARAPELKEEVSNKSFLPGFETEGMIKSPNILAVAPSLDNLKKREKMLEVSSSEPVDFALERVLGKNDAVYSNFVDLIEVVKQKVGKVIVKDGSRNVACATGFLVSDQLLLTNWHVFKVKEDVKNSEVEFFYEFDIDGDPKPTVTFRLDAETFFFSSKTLDYCFVAVKSTDITGAHLLNEIGYIFLDPSIGKLGNENEEKLNIIHHPDGDYKQLSIRQNLFIKITDTTIWYQTDTAQGSSGSPVFNDQWQVVALHHMGIAQKNELGQYIDKDGNPIPEKDGQIDSSKVVWIANEGIRISVLLADIFSKFPDNTLIAGLKVNAPFKVISAGHPDIRSISTSDITKPVNAAPTTQLIESKKINKNPMEPSDQHNIHVSLPSSLLNESGIVTISISTHKAFHQQVPTAIDIAAQPALLTSDEELTLALENKKLEDSTDYSLCKGYQMNFLGNGDKSIAMPQPNEKIRKFIAKVSGSNGIVLKYYNYSSIFNSVRMMPIISCVNVTGNPAERLNKQKRQDNWLRDSRLSSFDIQLDDDWYKGSGFDRGHMTRREDANWGATAEDALRNANLTCMYTNACPQVPKINRPEGGKTIGLWGKLEQVVLEKGVEREVSRTSKISVFNGPIFKDDDPVYKGIQVPMDFFKIVLWLTDLGALKATAFRLTQTKLVANIDFEEIDIDQNTEFMPFQISIKQLGLDTNIDFSGIEKFDTFETNQSPDLTEESLKKHLNYHNQKAMD